MLNHGGNGLGSDSLALAIPIDKITKLAILGVPIEFLYDRQSNELTTLHVLDDQGEVPPLPRIVLSLLDILPGCRLGFILLASNRKKLYESIAIAFN